MEEAQYSLNSCSRIAISTVDEFLYHKIAEILFLSFRIFRKKKLKEHYKLFNECEPRTNRDIHFFKIQPTQNFSMATVKCFLLLSNN
jgi:hypothetical protein